MDQKLFKQLYAACFSGETPKEIDHCFANYLSAATPLYQSAENGLSAMLFLIDCSLIKGDKQWPFYYLYAACTAKQFRGQGQMTNLLARAVQTAATQNKAGICLLPATEPLYRFYQKNGYQSRLSAATFTATPVKNECCTTLTAEEYLACRKKLLKNETFVALNSPALLAALRQTKRYKIETEKGEAIAAFEPEANRITELLGTPAAAISLAGAVCEKEKQKSLTVFCPDNPAWQAAKNAVQNFKTVSRGAVWFAKTEDMPSADEIYLGFALD